MIAKKFIGSWTIDETSEWEPNFLHMIETAKIVISSKGSGRLRFGAIEAELDLEPDERNPQETLLFTFAGHDEGDPICGRGSVKRDGALLVGHLAFHLGERCSFKASKRLAP